MVRTAHFIPRAVLLGAFTTLVVVMMLAIRQPDNSFAAAQAIAAVTPDTEQPQPPPESAQAEVCVIGGVTFENTRATPADCEGLDALRTAIPTPVWNVDTIGDPCGLPGISCHPAGSPDGPGVNAITISRRNGGTLPSEIGKFANLNSLKISNNRLTGTIPSEIGNLSNLRKLNIINEELDGAIPASIGSLSNLTVLNLSQNALSGPIPAELSALGNLEIFNLSNNQLTGEVPDIFGAMPKLTSVILSGNKLTGALPATLGGSQTLKTLFLANNKLSGSLSGDFFATSAGEGGSLQAVNLTNNDLSGSIPASLFGPSLKTIELSRNQFNGNLSFPEAGLPNVTKINLERNKLEGEIPAGLFVSPQITELDLSDNSLKGALPAEIGEGKTITRLDVSNNAISGSIPETISGLKSLRNLQIGWNQLSGTIPTSFPTSISRLGFLPNGCLSTDDQAIRSYLSSKGYSEPYGPCGLGDDNWGEKTSCKATTDTKGTITFRAVNPSDAKIDVRVTYITESQRQFGREVVVEPKSAGQVTVKDFPKGEYTVTAAINNKPMYQGSGTFSCEDTGGTEEGDEPVTVPSIECLAATAKVNVKLVNPTGTGKAVDFDIQIGSSIKRKATVPEGSSKMVYAWGFRDGLVSVTGTANGKALAGTAAVADCTGAGANPIEMAGSCMPGPGGITRGRLDVAVKNTSSERAVFKVNMDDGNTSRTRTRTLSTNQLWKVVVPNLNDGSYDVSVLQSGDAVQDGSKTVEIACTPASDAASDDVVATTSCLAGNVRADVMIRNTTEAAATYAASFGTGGVEKSLSVEGGKRGRLVLFNTGTGTGDITVTRGGTEIYTLPVTESPCS